MADLSDAQRKRAEARRRRRREEHDKNEPQAQNDGTAEEADSEEHQPLDAVVHAAKVAAAGAAVGAAAAAARALASQRGEDGGEDRQTQAAVDAAPPEEDVEQAEPETDERPPPEEPQQGQQLEEPQEPRAPEPEEEREPVEGAPLGDAKEVVARAREQLEALLGRRPESVSAVERTHDGWVVVLEVVELSRVPESTDVLGSYELELDEDLNFRRYEQSRRYYRSQADRGEQP
jgi:hypothetical protein